MLTTTDIKNYEKGTLPKHPFYRQDVDAAEAISIHMDGKFPEGLLAAERPGESPKIKRYRKDYYKPKTKRPINKVFNTLSKIRKSQDWAIRHLKETPSSIVENETLEYFMEQDFFEYTSFTNWVFNIMLRYYCFDSNSVILWMPSNMEKKDNEYYRPMPVLFTSEQKIYYDKEHYVLKSKEKSKAQEQVSLSYFGGTVYYAVDKTTIQRFEQVNNDFEFKEAWRYNHNLGFLPVVTIQGVEQESTPEQCHYLSRLSPMIPDLDEAACISSDLKAEVLMHVNSKFWAYESQQCKKCRGSGSLVSKDKEAPVQCDSCKGKGTVAFDPFEYFSVQQESGKAQVPVPPAGYIEKSIDPAKFLKEMVSDSIRDGLSAIGMEILDTIPLNQSGTAKEWDRTEPNAFLHANGEDLVRVMDDSYYIVNEYRFKDVITSEEKRKEMLPEISVPEKFDILTEGMLQQEIVNLVTAKADPSLIKSSSIEYVNKKYSTDDELRESMLLKIELDPFYGVAEETLELRKLGQGVSIINYTIHCNISEFVDRLIEEKKVSEEKSEMFEVLVTYAKEEIKLPTQSETELEEDGDTSTNS